MAEHRDGVVAEIKNLIVGSADPNSPQCQDLLDQLCEVDTQWVNVVRDLGEMPVLECILLRQMFRNVSREVAAMETALPEFDNRGLGIEEVTDKYEECKVRTKS